MKNSLSKLTKISDTLVSHQTYYEFNKIDEHLSKQYPEAKERSCYTK